MHTPICDRFGIEFPIFAFSHCRDVVAAVSKAGGMGVLGALYFTPEELEIELNWIDEHVDGRPYGVDLVMPATLLEEARGADSDPAELERQLEAMIPQANRDFVEKVLAEHNIAPLPEEAHPHHLLGWTDTTGLAQMDVALEHPVSLLVNALGPPPAEVVQTAHERGIAVAALASSPRHALKHKENGVDIIVAQGTEAGGHTGDISSVVLWPEVIDAVGPDTAVLAAGGIGRGSQIAAAIAMGAQGAWTGSIWLTVAESDMAPLVTEKLLAATSRDTVRSRSLTGKPARQLRTAWTDAFEREDSPGYLPMPLQFMLVSDAYGRINRSQDRDLIGAPVGQIVGQMNAVRPVRDVMFDLVDEYVTASERLARVTERVAPRSLVSSGREHRESVGVTSVLQAPQRGLACGAHDRGVAFRVHRVHPHRFLVGGAGLEHDDGDPAPAQSPDFLLQAEPEVPTHRLAEGEDRCVARGGHRRRHQDEVEVLGAQDVGVGGGVHPTVDVEPTVDLDRLEVPRDRGRRADRGGDVGLRCALATEHDAAGVVHADRADPQRVRGPARARERPQRAGPALDRYPTGGEGHTEHRLRPDLERPGDGPGHETGMGRLGPGARTDRRGPVTGLAEPADELRARLGE